MLDVPSGDLAAVCAVADKSVNETLAFSRYFDLHGAAVAGCCCGAVLLAVRALGRKVDLLTHVVGVVGL